MMETDLKILSVGSQGPSGPQGAQGPQGVPGADASLPADFLEVLAPVATENDAGLRLVPNETGGLDLALWNQDAGVYQRVRIENDAAGNPTITFANLIP